MRRVRRKKQRSPVFVLVAGNELPRFQHFLCVQEWRSARQNQLVGLAQVNVSAKRRVAENKRQIAIGLERPIKTIEGVGSEELRCFQGSVSAQAIQILLILPCLIARYDVVTSIH